MKIELNITNTWKVSTITFTALKRKRKTKMNFKKCKWWIYLRRFPYKQHLEQIRSCITDFKNFQPCFACFSSIFDTSCILSAFQYFFTTSLTVGFSQLCFPHFSQKKRNLLRESTEFLKAWIEIQWRLIA